MGQEIVYCNSCKSRLTGKDFDKGKAFRIENEILCLDCARKVLESLPPAERDAFAAKMKAPEARRTSTQRIPLAHPPEAEGAAARRPGPGSSARIQRIGTGSSTRLRALKDVPLGEDASAGEAAAPSRSRWVLPAAGGGLALVAVLLTCPHLLVCPPKGLSSRRAGLGESPSARPMTTTT